MWAPNIPEWEVVEFGAALAGLILVTVNPSYKPSELSYVLEQSAAAGIFLLPEFRGNPMAQSLETVRAELPVLREAVSFTDFDVISGVRLAHADIPGGRRGRPRPDPVHLGHDGLSEGRAPASSRPHEQRPHDARPLRLRAG